MSNEDNGGNGAAMPPALADWEDAIGEALLVDGTGVIAPAGLLGETEDLSVDDVAAEPAAPVYEFPPFELVAEPVIDLQAKSGLVVSKTICLALKRSKFGNRRKATMGDVTVQSDKALLSLSKTLLASVELDAITKLDGEIAKYLKSVCLKSMFKGGIYLLPVGLVKETHESLKAFALRRQALVAAAVEQYPTRVSETATRLDVLGDVGDYPAVEDFASSFSLSWEYVTFDTPAKLKEIDVAIFADAQEKAQERLKGVANECEQAMRAGMLDLVNRMVERLTPDDEGKPKRFTKSLVENMGEFLRTFEMRNITDDSQLSQLVARARMVLDGVDPNGLRKDEALRTAIAGQFTQIQSLMSGMVVDAPTRMISVDDDDE